MSQETTTTQTDIAMLPPAERAVIVLSSTKTEADLRAMVEQAQAITEVIDIAGRDQAHRMGMTLKKARTTIEKTGKTARDDATAFAKAVITEEKRLIAITESEEQRVLGLRDSYDARVEAEKQAKEAKLAQFQVMIGHIRDLPLEMAGAPSADILAEIEVMQLFSPTEDVFGELLEECKVAAAESLARLKALHESVVAQEVAKAEAEAAAAAERQRIEQARIEAERVMAEQRAELAAQRAAIEEEKRKYAEDLAAARAELAAARAAIEAELNAARAELDAEKAKIEAAMAVPVAQEDHPADDAQQQDIFETVEVATAEEQPVAVAEEQVDVPASEEVAEPPIFEPYSSWLVRQGAIHTAAQFVALSKKVDAVGFADFATHLRDIAVELENGIHDAALTAADHAAIVAADNELMDATVECIDALSTSSHVKELEAA